MTGKTHVPETGTIRADDGVVVTPAVLQAVAGRIRERLTAYFPGLADASGASLHVTRLGEPSSYPLFNVRVSGSGVGRERELIVKFAPVFEENNEGLTEYRHLVAMHDRVGPVSPTRVPRPLDFFEDVNALVMERVGGERFSRMILRDGSFFASRAAARRLCEAARLSGSWLATYHEVARREDASPFDASFLTLVTEKLSAFAEFGFPARAAKTVAETARRLNEFGGSRRVPVADVHGDFGPQNVHVGDGCVYVFDLNYHVAGPVYDDVDYFLVTLETMNPYPRQWFLDRRRVAAMREPFLEGYFGGAPADPLRRVYVEGYYLKSLLFRCAKQRRNTARRGRLALALYDASRVRDFYPRRLEIQCRLVGHCLDSMPGGNRS